MRVAILGVGGLGRTVALELASDPRITEILLVDHRGERAKALQSIGRTAAVSAYAADVKDPVALRRILSRVDVAVNTTLPEFNLLIMRACIDAGCGYVDTSGWHPGPGGGPREGKGDVLDQLRQDVVWRDKGLGAIVCMGSEPGLTNVMARMASDRLATIDAIRIRVASTADPKTEGYPFYSRETFLDDILATPVVWDGAAHVERDPTSGEEVFEFPPPIGPRPVHLVRHSEVMSLPLRLGKPVGHADYKGAFSIHLIRAVHSLHALGLLTKGHVVKLTGQRAPFREIFLSSWPEPSTIIGPMPGAMAVVTDVDGTTSEGVRTTIRSWVKLEHKEANRRRGTTAEPYLSAVAGATACVLVGLKKTPRLGVLAPEELSPDVVRTELEARGIQFQSVETPREKPVEVPVA